MSKQHITYRPQIKHTADYQTDKAISQQDVEVKPGGGRKPLDTQSIPQIENNIEYLDRALKAIPTNLSRALHEIYDPIKDMFYETLIDKIVDPNPPKPPIEIIPKPGDPEPDPPPGPGPTPDPNPDPEPDPENKKKVFPIVLKPINFKDPGDPGDEPGPEIPEDTRVFPIILQTIKDENKDPEDELPIEAPNPIVLLPIVSPGYNPGDKPGPGDDDDDDEEDDDDDDLWKKPDTQIIYREINIRKIIDKEFIYLLTKVILFYTEKLKDLINNYIYNVLRNTVGMASENIIFVNNSIDLTSNDILNHSKHLLDISVKDEDVAALKTEYLKNTFNVKQTTTHLKSFYVANELRCRYTDIKYSNGKSMPNSTSDALLKQMHMKYELQFRNDFENLFRYLNSSLKVTADIFTIHMEDSISKTTLVKKNGRRKK